MFLNVAGNLADSDMRFLMDVLSPLDSVWDKLMSRIEQCADPDSYGLLDKTDHLAGMGFVCCQKYMSSVYPQVKRSKGNALKFPPFISGSTTYAEAINAYANYWKHGEEWTYPLKGVARRTMGTMREAVLKEDCTEYLCMNGLYLIADSTQQPFSKLIDILTMWRESLITPV